MAAPAFSRRLSMSFALGVVLGLGEALLSARWQLIAHDPWAALTGLRNLVAVYVLATAGAALFVPWGWLLRGAVIAFATTQIAQIVLGTNLASRALFESGTIVIASALIASATYTAFGAAREPRVGALRVLVLLGVTVFALPWLRAHDPTTEERIKRSKAAARPGRPASRPNVILLTFDTLRADHLGVYGAPGGGTPNLDALADAGARFERAIAQAPLTPPSHASMMTGVYPAEHGVRGVVGGNRLRSERRMLAEMLRADGFATAAILAAAPLRPGSGLERGFETYDFAYPPNAYPFFGFRESLVAKLSMRVQLVPDRWSYRGAEEQTTRAIAWLSSRDETRPFFLWVHYFDAHDPYAPPGRFLRAAGGWLKAVRDRRHLYESEVRYLDDEVGRLLGYLDAAGIADATVVLGISDHGEGLGEHGYVGHSERLFDEQLKIPLLLRFPPRIPAGSVVTSQVRALDVMPTILDCVGLEAPQDIAGRSLLPLVGAEPSPRLAISETMERRDQTFLAVSDGRYKLIRSLNGGGDTLFDVVIDPAELVNLVGDRPSVADRLRSHLDAYAAGASFVVSE